MRVHDHSDESNLHASQSYSGLSHDDHDHEVHGRSSHNDGNGEVLGGGRLSSLHSGHTHIQEVKLRDGIPIASHY